ncbi:PREDICTED: uncharacterized protein LOC109466395 [Branchiostoma belcheri]|uniref:Uncharacterized protein LOC109466395 n=1 Tax=Branchiostoma belcheri TaxID=7741 RepID=A0A6P4YLT5_BRABE|nr:PREDICTED: uncharacterized protein LOC109466395 [Branchiostoma belcheri]
MALLFRDLQSIRLRQEVSLLLNMDQPISGHDYRLLAELLGYEYTLIRAFGGTSNPTLRLLEDWETKKDATVQKLCDCLEEMERYDVLELIQDHVKHVKQTEARRPLVVQQETGRAASDSVTSHGGFTISERTDVRPSVIDSNLSPPAPIGSESSVPSGSFTTVGTFVCTIMRIPPDRGLLSAVSTSITNFQLLLAAILLANDVMYGFGANIRGFHLSEHVMIFLPLWEFFYCEPRVKTNCELSRIITEKTLQTKDTCEDFFEDEKLQKLKALRSRIAYSLRTAILLTLMIELVFIMFILARWHSDIRSDFFGAVFITFVSDTAFNCWLYFCHYHSIKTEKLDRRFVFYDLMMFVNMSNSSVSLKLAPL